MQLYQGQIYFAANDGRATWRGAPAALWRTDGTSQGTQLVHALAVGALPSWARRLTVAGNRLYFQVYNETTGTPVSGGLVLTGANDGEHGRELWAIPVGD